jgi:putative flippase GtrA
MIDLYNPKLHISNIDGGKRMGDETVNAGRKEKLERLAKVGYWVTIVYIVIVGLSLAYGAPVGVADNVTIFSSFLFIFFWRYLGLASRGKDERLAKMATRAMTTSWALTLLITTALITLTANYFQNMTAAQILGIIAAVMASTMAVSNEVYKRRGDVNW